ncbi:MAG: hypothetical protein RIS70_4324 [Planctomycetota bacterium]
MHSHRFSFFAGLLLWFASCLSVIGAEEADSGRQFLDFIKQQASALRGADKVPSTADAWQAQRVELRRSLEQAWGTFPATPCPLESKKLGELKRDGYRVEKWIFQTRPGVWMTANCYVPDSPGRHPAILAVHGHWRGAKQDPAVQQRCIGPAKLGYVVLVVDAFGAGERGVGEALGEYHGEMVAATLFPIGLPLSGLQVYENMRAVDFLQARDDVDPERIGITGASGGGNQSMYAGAWDERLGGVVPVCSVGNYQAYLGAACCMCEVVPGALRFTEEWAVLGLTAPRGLMVVNATQDAFQFSVGEAKKSLELTAKVYELTGRPGNVRHAVFDWKHDYSQAMRETMYGFMNRHLKGGEKDDPIADPPMQTEDPEALRCFPGDTRPDDWMTIPRFAASEGRKIIASREVPAKAEAWRTEAAKRRESLVRVLGGFPEPTPLQVREVDGGGQVRKFTFSPEPGLSLTAVRHRGTDSRRLAVLLDADGAVKADAHPLAAAMRKAGWSTVALDLRATGDQAWKSDSIGRAPDHNTAEWSLWIGRPLAGQWAWDAMRLIDAVAAEAPEEVAVIGFGSAGITALAVSAVDARVTHCVTVDCLASYLTESPYMGQRLAIMIPRIIPEVGDVAHLAALSRAKRLVIAGGVLGDGKSLDRVARDSTFRFTRTSRTLEGKPMELVEPAELMSLIADRNRF